jgi:collagenase-like PrtC family protease
MRPDLTIGPILFHWPAERMRDFYFRIAHEAPVDTVYLGEVVCSKRAPFFEPHYAEVSARLAQAGKTVVFSTLAEAMIKRERKMIAEMCGQEDFAVEANDNAALFHLRGKPHRVGPFVNVYNEDTLAFLAAKGATHITLPQELPAGALAVLGAAARQFGVGLEVQVHGRIPLALSARCYHARAHGRVKDNCQFVCEQDPDGMELKTLDGRPFLVVNGIQTLSHTCLNLAYELTALAAMGIGAFRLSPHSGDMVGTARIFRALADGEISPDEATARLGETGFAAPFANGFYHRREGYRWGVDATAL